MADINSTIDIYLSIWGEADTTRRAKLIEQAWTPDGRLIDSPLSGEGHAGINDMALAMQTHYAGHHFRRVSGIDAHHGFLRFAWELVAPDGAVAIAGIDVAEVDDEGRLVRVTGFFEPLPVLEAA